MRAPKNPLKRRRPAKPGRPTAVAPPPAGRRHKPAIEPPGTSLAIHKPGKEPSIARPMPWTEMSSLRERMDRLFDRLLGFEWGELSAFGAWAPRLDLSETDENLIAKVEIPGIDPKDLQVSLQENMLTIKGEKKHEKEEKDERLHRVERSYGAFTRSTWLPVAVDHERVEASFKNGLLTVILPKTPSAKAREIRVEAEKEPSSEGGRPS